MEKMIIVSATAVVMKSNISSILSDLGDDIDYGKVQQLSLTVLDPNYDESCARVCYDITFSGEAGSIKDYAKGVLDLIIGEVEDFNICAVDDDGGQEKTCCGTDSE